MGSLTVGSFDSFAADYDRFASLEPAWLPQWLAHHLQRPGRRALDAGCGSGRHTLPLADHFEEVLGIDLSGPLIDIARHRRPHPRVRYEVGDLLEVRQVDGFDLVFSASALHHMADLGGALRHLRALVAPGGTAILIDRVARRPTPPRWVYLLGAVRDIPGDILRYGWRQAVWLFEFRTSRPWLDHLATDRYLRRPEFEELYRAEFPGARFEALEDAHALIWHAPN